MDAWFPSPEHYCLFDTAIGRCGIAWNGHGLTRLRLPEANPAATERRLRGPARAPAPPSPAIQPIIAAIQHYLASNRVDFDAVAVDLTGVAPFEQEVYRAARAVRWGETTSYGELARRIGAPDAARAVGQALGHNPVPVIIPCHRILASGRRLGGFSAPGGTFTKDRLLALEGVNLSGGFTAPRLPGL